MATIKHLSVSAPANEIINEIESNGAVIIDGFLTTETLDQFNAEINQLYRCPCSICLINCS